MTKQLSFIKNELSLLSRNDKENFIENSNLTDREVKLLKLRFIEGLSLKECADRFGIEEDSVNKLQLRTAKKLYNFLNYS